MLRYEVQVEKPSLDTSFNVMIENFQGTLDGLKEAQAYQQIMQARGFVATLKKTIKI
jgi:hypothetical protein